MLLKCYQVDSKRFCYRKSQFKLIFKSHYQILFCIVSQENLQIECLTSESAFENLVNYTQFLINELFKKSTYDGLY